MSEFIDLIAPLIQREAKNRGYKVCSPIIAQAICESNWGKSVLSKTYHNYFGMKAGSSWKGKTVNLKTREEYTAGTLTTIKDNFRVYSSMEEGVKGYFDFISTKRYANLKTAETPLQYLQFIKADGYATSSTYVNTNMNIVTKNNLTIYDNFNVVVPEVPSVPVVENSPYLKYYTIGKVYTLQANMYVRKTANGEKTNYSQLSSNAKANGYADANGKGILKKGTKVTCKEVCAVDNQVWIRIPSGWVCGYNGSKQYVL